MDGERKKLGSRKHFLKFPANEKDRDGVSLSHFLLNFHFNWVSPGFTQENNLKLRILICWGIMCVCVHALINKEKDTVSKTCC